MQAKLQIVEVSDGLVITVTRPRYLFWGLAELLIGVLVLAWAVERYRMQKATDAFAMGLSGVFALASAPRLLREQSAVLHVNNLELKVSGPLARTAYVCRADVETLEHAIGHRSAPSGLYAKHGWSNSCLLPLLNEEQTNEVVDAIYRRFPDTGFCAKRDQSFITLGLSN